jgi:hypothetical protein
MSLWAAAARLASKVPECEIGHIRSPLISLEGHSEREERR